MGLFLRFSFDVQVQEIESELNSRKQEEAKRRRDVQEISDQVTALQLELSGLDDTVDYQVSEHDQCV